MKSNVKGQNQLLIPLIILIGAALALAADITLNVTNSTPTGRFIGITQTEEKSFPIEVWANTSIRLETIESLVRATLILDNGTLLGNQQIDLYFNDSLLGSNFTNSEGFVDFPVFDSRIIKAIFNGGEYLNPSQSEVAIGNATYNETYNETNITELNSTSISAWAIPNPVSQDKSTTLYCDYKSDNISISRATVVFRIDNDNYTAIWSDEYWIYDYKLKNNEEKIVYCYANASGFESNSASFILKVNETKNINVLSEELEQGEAEIGKPVRWIKKIKVKNLFKQKMLFDLSSFIPKNAFNISLYGDKEIGIDETKEYVLEYFTDAPKIYEEIINKYKKLITISSEFSYRNIKTYTDLADYPEKAIRLYWFVDSKKIDVTHDLSINLKFIDTNNNGLIDRLEWITPHTSNQTFEVDIIVLNPYTVVRNNENWTVAFNTTGEADLIINSTNAEWTEFLKDNENTKDEMRFLEISCGENSLKNSLELIDENENYYNYSQLSENDSIKIKKLLIKNYSCDDIGYITNNMLIAGYAILQFNFGNQVAYAYDATTYNLYPNTTHNKAYYNKTNSTDCSATILNRIGTEFSDLNYNSTNVSDNNRYAQATSSTVLYDTNCSYYRFTFNASSSLFPNTVSIGLLHRGLYEDIAGCGLAALYYYKVSSSTWTSWDSISTSETNISKIFTTISDIRNSTDGLVKFGIIISAYYEFGTCTATARTNLAMINITTDNTPPQWVVNSNTTNSTFAGYPANFTLNWTDDYQLAGYIFSTNNSGTWRNSSYIAFSGTSNTSWNVTTLNTTVGIKVAWCFYANDTSGNMNRTNCDDGKQFILNTTLDIIPPTYSKNWTNTIVAGTPCNFSLEWNDNYWLNNTGQWIFSTNNSGTWRNYTATSVLIPSISVNKGYNSTESLRYISSTNPSPDNATTPLIDVNYSQVNASDDYRINYSSSSPNTNNDNYTFYRWTFNLTQLLPGYDINVISSICYRVEGYYQSSSGEGSAGVSYKNMSSGSWSSSSTLSLLSSDYNTTYCFNSNYNKSQLINTTDGTFQLSTFVDSYYDFVPDTTTVYIDYIEINVTMNNDTRTTLNFTNTPQNVSYVLTLNSTAWTKVAWCYYAFDNSGNWNNTNCQAGNQFILNTTDAAPTYSSNSTNSTLAGTPIEHRLNWQDGSGLSGHIFSFWNGTDLVNQTPFNVTDKSSELTFYANNTIDDIYSTDWETSLANNWITYDLGVEVLVTAVRIYSDDWTSNLRPCSISVYVSKDKINWGSSVGYCIFDQSTAWHWCDITDKSGRYANISVNTSSSGSCSNTVIGLMGFYEFDFNSTGMYNDSWVAMTGATNWSNVTKVVNSTVGATIKWCVYANDTYNIWNGTSCSNPFNYTTSNSNPSIVNQQSFTNWTLGEGYNISANATDYNGLNDIQNCTVYHSPSYILNQSCLLGYNCKLGIYNNANGNCTTNISVNEQNLFVWSNDISTTNIQNHDIVANETEGYVYVVDNNAVVYKINATNGTVIASNNVSTSTDVRGLSQDDKFLYFGTSLSSLIKVNKTNFSNYTEINIPTPSVWSTAVDSNYVYVGGHTSGNLTALHKTNLTNAWSIKWAGAVEPVYDIVVNETAGWLYECWNRNVSRINRTNGNWNWNTSLNYSKPCRSIALDNYTGNLWAGDNNNTLYRINEADGSILNWTYFGTSNIILYKIVFDNDYVYTFDNGGNVRKINKTNLTDIKWNFSISTIAWYGADGDTNYLYTYDYNTGEVFKLNKSGLTNYTSNKRIYSKIRFTDTYGLYSDTNVDSNVMPDATPPQWIVNSNSTNTTVAGAPANFTLNWTDNYQLAGYIFSTNNSGTWRNSSYVTFTGATNVSWNVTTLNTTVGLKVAWCYYANDTTGNMNATNCQNDNTYFYLTTTDGTPPQWVTGSNSTNSTVAGVPVEFKLNWSDTIGLYGYILSIDNCTGSFSNQSFKTFGRPYWYGKVETYGKVTNETSSFDKLFNDTSTWANINGTNTVLRVLFLLNFTNVKASQKLFYTWKNNTKSFSEDSDFYPNLKIWNYTKGDYDLIDYTVGDWSGNFVTESWAITSDYVSNGYLNITFSSRYQLQGNISVSDVYVGTNESMSFDTVVINSTSFCTMRWRFFANDTSGNQNVSDDITFKTVPSYCSYSMQNWELPYTITKNNSYYCLASDEYTTTSTAITFQSGIQNSTLDCLGYTLDSDDGIRTAISISGATTQNNTVKNCIITDFQDAISLSSSHNNNITNNTLSSCGSGGNEGLYLSNSYNNTITNNNIVNNEGYGITLSGSSSGNNTITGGSISNNSVTYADYHLTNIPSTNYFTNTNFTDARKIYFGDATSWFNYGNDTSNLWLKTNVSAASTLTRKLINWNQTLMQWNDSSYSATTATYNITGLHASKGYIIYNNSVIAYRSQTDASGNLPSFTIYLGSEHEIKADEDATPPQWVAGSNATNTTAAGYVANFSLQWNDTLALQPGGQWIFSTNNSGTWRNYTATSVLIPSISVNKGYNSTASLGYISSTNPSPDNATTPLIDVNYSQVNTSDDYRINYSSSSPNANNDNYTFYRWTFNLTQLLPGYDINVISSICYRVEGNFTTSGAAGSATVRYKNMSSGSWSSSSTLSLLSSDYNTTYCFNSSYNKSQLINTTDGTFQLSTVANSYHETGPDTTTVYIDYIEINVTMNNDTRTTLNFSTTPQNVSYVLTLNSTIGTKIGWCYYANDNAGNWNGTNCQAGNQFILNTTDGTPPQWVVNSNSTSTTAVGVPANFTLNWTDNYQLAGYIFSTNNTGTWRNDTYKTFSGTTNVSWNVTTLNSTVGLKVAWCYYANDTYGNMNRTNCDDGKQFILTTIDVIPPTYSLNSTNTTAAGTPANFSLQWNDNIALQANGQWIFSSNNSGYWRNYTFVNILLPKMINNPFYYTTSTTDTYANPGTSSSYTEGSSYYYQINVSDDNIFSDTITSPLSSSYYYRHFKFEFNLSNYTANEINWIQYCYEGYWENNNGPTYGSGKLYYYNVSSSGWTLDQILGYTKSTKCKNITNASEIINSTGFMKFGASFGAKGYQIGEWFETITTGYVDFVNLTINTNLTNFTTTPQNSTYALTLNSTLGTTVGWCYYAKDNAGNWNGTSCSNPFILTTNDVTPPQWVAGSNSTNTTVAGQSANFTLNWTDNYQLAGYIFSTNNTGTWRNDTYKTFSGTTNVSWNVTTLNSTVGLKVAWCYYANDTYGNMNRTNCDDGKQFILTTIDVIPPTYSLNSTNTTAAGTPANFSLQWNDNIALQANGQWIFSSNNSGYWRNYTAPLQIPNIHYNLGYNSSRNLASGTPDNATTEILDVNYSQVNSSDNVWLLISTNLYTYEYFRFVFNFSDYNINNISSICYRVEGHYIDGMEQSGCLKTKNVSSGTWVGQNCLETSDSNITMCYTSHFNDWWINSTDKTFQLGIIDDGTIVYLDYIEINVTTNQTSFSATPQNVSYVLTLNSTVGTKVGWCYYAKDNAGNWNNSCSNPFILTTNDVTPPQWVAGSNSTNTTVAGQSANFTLNWTDNYQLAGYIFSTNNSGTWRNSSYISFSGTQNKSWNVTTLNTTVGLRVSWCFYANDTYGNMNATNCQAGNEFILTMIAGISFNVTLPDNSNTTSSESGASTNDEEFNATMATIANVNPCVKGAKWANSNLDRCKSITITNAGTSTLTDFPAYINLTKDGDMLSNYQDLRFYNTSCSNGGSLLDYEIENYTTNNADIWIRIPSLQTTGKIISVYYKNTSAVESGQNATGVWDSNYVMVQHLKENSGTLNDSTLNGNSGTQSGGVTYLATGKINGAVGFDGSDDLVNVTNPNNLNVDNFTVEVWTKLASTSQTSCAKLIIKDKGTACGTTYPYGFQDDCTAGAGKLWAYSYTSAIKEVRGPAWTSIGTNNWVHIVMTYNNSNLTLYINGTQYNSTTSTGTLCANTNTLLIGGRPGPQYFNGTLDEARISNISRSSDWINQSYQMVQNQNSFVSLGSEETGNSCQTSLIANFRVNNTGSVNENITMCINASLPSKITLFGTLTNDPYSSPSTIPACSAGFWIANSSLPINAMDEFWIWTNFTGVAVGDDAARELYINATQSGT